jgi:uncharacterized protein (DUF952 family)
VSLIYKIIAGAAWEAALAQGRLDGAGVDLRDGYIHLSTAEQAPETARRHFHGQADLVLVAFDPADLVDLRWEPSRGGQLFPHVHGAIDPALARSVTPAPLDAAGEPELDLGG